MPQPTPAQGHLDRYLSNLSISFVQGSENFVAGKTFPIVPVQFASDKYLTYDRGYFWRDEVGPRPLGGRANLIGAKIGSGQYLCEEQALAAMLDDRERANATPPYDPEATKVLILTQNMLIHQDREWCDKYFKTGVWTNDVTGDAAPNADDEFLHWDDADADPVQDVDKWRTRMMKVTGYRPNTIVFGAEAFITAKNNKTILDRIKYTQRGIVTPELLAAMFEVDRVLVATGIYNAGAEGAADDIKFIANDNAMLMCYAAPNAGLNMPSAGYTFHWSGLLGSGGLVTPVMRWRDDPAHSDGFELRMAYDQKVVAPDLGVFFSGIKTPA